jgi:4'-phosphopantetheinyl transferase
MGLDPSVIQFKRVGEGKPVLKNPTVHLDFNLSHSHDYFAIALTSKGEVGVDIEQIRPPQHLTQIAERFFSAPEVDLIKQEADPAKQTQIFAKFWSGKEALVKTVGGGVFKNVHEVLVDETSWKIKRLPLEFGSLSDWNLQFFEAVPGYTCSVAFKTSSLGT